MNTVNFFASIFVEADGRTIRQHNFVQRAQLPRPPLIGESVDFAPEHWKNDDEMMFEVVEITTLMKVRELKIVLESWQVEEADETDWFKSIVECKFQLLETLEFGDEEIPEETEAVEKPQETKV